MVRIKKGYQKNRMDLKNNKYFTITKIKQNHIFTNLKHIFNNIK